MKRSPRAIAVIVFIGLVVIAYLGGFIWLLSQII